jgi:hypothetical protein
VNSMILTRKIMYWRRLLIRCSLSSLISLSAEKEFFGAEFFYSVAEFGGGCVRLLHCG